MLAGLPCLQSHKYDASRCEEDLLNSFGMDERGALRYRHQPVTSHSLGHDLRPLAGWDSL